MTNLLFLIDTLSVRRGTELHLLELTRRLPALGFRPIVCSLGGDEPMLREMAAAGLETWPLPILRAYSPAGWRAIRTLVDRVRAERVELIQSYHFKSDLVGCVVSALTGVPQVSSRRDLGFMHTRLQRTIYRRINGRMRAFIAPSDAVRRKLIDVDAVPGDRIHVVPNGVDLSRYLAVSASSSEAQARSSLSIAPGECAIGMVASLNPVKDHPTLLHAFARVSEQEPNTRLVLVGAGSCAVDLRDLARTLGIGGRVIFAGERDDIPDVLSAFDVFAFSSSSEGMPNAVLEAMAAGLPVVATDAGGTRDCVEHERTGLLVPVGDVEQFARALLALVRSPPHRHALGFAARRRVRERFDLGVMVERTAALYADLGLVRSTRVSRVA